MKKIFLMMLSALMILALTACSNSDAAGMSTTEGVSGKKILVAYFSCTGNTKTLAQNVSEAIGADLYEIKPAMPYTAGDLHYTRLKIGLTV